MPTYRVYLTTSVSHVVEVTADDRDEAIDLALTEGAPGLMFLDHTYPDTGDWQVADEANDVELVEDGA